MYEIRVYVSVSIIACAGLPLLVSMHRGGVSYGFDLKMKKIKEFDKVKSEMQVFA